MKFIRKRLQVFVSSTYSDLIDDRQAAVEAILTAGHIPAGMELFTAGDESQMDVIKQWIDESDVYLVILGGRYGSVEPRTGKSYTQLEYEYAIEKEKPLFACVITKSALESRVRTHGTEVMETEHPQELKMFRELVLSRMVRFWEDSKDIKIAIGETLSHFARREDLVGWVRASDQANLPALADEITRLSSENADLRSRLEDSSAKDAYAGLAFEELLALLKERGLLDGITDADNRSQMGQIFTILRGFDSAGLSELSALGLLQPTENSFGAPQYVLSDDGRRFLNRFEVSRIADSSGAEQANSAEAKSRVAD